MCYAGAAGAGEEGYGGVFEGREAEGLSLASFVARQFFHCESHVLG